MICDVCNVRERKVTVFYLSSELRFIFVRNTAAECGATVDSGKPLEMTDDIQEKIQWLKDNIEPVGQVQDYMRGTAEYRREWIKDKNRTVAEIVAEFPRLLDEGMVR